MRFKAFFSDRFGTIQNIELRGNKLISIVQGSSFGSGMYGPIKRERRVHPSSADWGALKAAFDRADIWAWQGTYRNADFQGGGSAWSLEIVYPGQRIVTVGYGTYPSDKTPLQSVDTESQRFQVVERAIERLIGRPLFN